MKIALAWLNSLLRPGNVTAEEAERLLTFVGFPIESAEPVALSSGGTDTLLDVEVTSNRGDCLSHVGVAREIAAVGGPAVPAGQFATNRRQLIEPEIALPAGTGGPISDYVTLENRVPGPLGQPGGGGGGGGGVGGCPIFTLRLLRGVKVGPSPAWLVSRLEAIGQRSINNVVDATNYVLMELGSPSHVFDLAKIKGTGSGASGKPAIIVRPALAGEKLALLDGKTIDLKPGELVVADGLRPSSLAGIMGGSDSGVTTSTTDVLLEVATWAPGVIRRCARRLGFRTDASYRFERRVDPRTVDAASRRVASLILQTAGGTLCEGVLTAGAPLPAPTVVALRPDRCRSVLGSGPGTAGNPFDDAAMRTALAAQGVQIAPQPATHRGQPAWSCTVPGWRPDITREEDLIEEVARTIGLDKIPVHERVAVRVAPPQSSELAARELTRVLTGLGFFETVTFSFVSAKSAKPFTPPGVTTLAVSDDRRGDEGTLRPSIIQSLLACRRANQAAKSAAPGDLRLFELASVYGESAPPNPSPGKHLENRNLGLLLDLPQPLPGKGSGGADAGFARCQGGLRLVRGVIEELVTALHGPGAAARLAFDSGPMPFSVLDPDASARVSLDGHPLGVAGLLTPSALSTAGLEHPVVVAELNLADLLKGYPPRSQVTALPVFPAVDRDLSVVVDEATRWGTIQSTIRTTNPQPRWLESLRFVGTYRGKPLDAAKKSVTLRMVFRDQSRTLRDDEVNAEVDSVIATLGRSLGAVVRI